MKTLSYFVSFIVSLLFIGGCGGGAELIKEEGDNYNYSVQVGYDKFENDTLINMINSDMEGSSFWGGLHYSINIQIKKNANKPDRFYYRLVGSSTRSFSIRSGSLGVSLMMKVDTVKKEYSSSWEKFDVMAFGSSTAYINTAYYNISKEELREVANSNVVNVRLITTSGEYLDFSFSKENIMNCKHFLNKYVK